MASLIQIKGGYYARFQDARREPRRVQFTLKTKRKDVARRLLATLERAYELGEFDPWTDDVQERLRTGGRGTPPSATPITLFEAFDRFIDARRTRGHAETTLTMYRYLLRDGLFPVIDPDTPERLTLAHLTRDNIARWVHAADIAPATRRSRYSHVRAFVRWCLREDLLQENPLKKFDVPSTPEKLPKAVTLDELDRICAAIREDARQCAGVQGYRQTDRVWLVPLFRFAFFTGLRASELARLKWKHLDLDQKRLYIFKQKNKKESVLPLVEKAIDALGEKRGAPDEYVFGARPTTRRSTQSFRSDISRAFTHYRRKAGITRKITLHGLRHGFATRLAEAGVAAHVIQYACRHSDIRVSEKYIHLTTESSRTLLDAAL